MEVFLMTCDWRNYMDEIIEEKPEPIKRGDSKTCGKGLCESNAFKIKIRQLESEIYKLKNGALMKYDPATGEQYPYPSQVDQYRKYHGKVAWLFNPWTGKSRYAQDVGSDCFGVLIVPQND